MALSLGHHVIYVLSLNCLLHIYACWLIAFVASVCWFVSLLVRIVIKRAPLRV